MTLAAAAAPARSPSQPLLCSWPGQHRLLLGAHAADCPDGRDARRHQWPQLAFISAVAFALGKGGTGCCSARTQPIARMGMMLADASGFRMQTLADSSGFRFRLRAEHGPTRQAPALSGLLTYHERRDATSPCAPRAHARLGAEHGPTGHDPGALSGLSTCLAQPRTRSSCDSERGPAGRHPCARPQSHQSRETRRDFSLRATRTCSPWC